jgi:hypothetical protein
MARIPGLTALSGVLLLAAAACRERDGCLGRRGHGNESWTRREHEGSLATCGSLEDFVVTNCPLTWNGIRSTARLTEV